MSNSFSYKLIAYFLLVINLQAASAQSKLSIKKHKIKSVTEYDFKTKNIIDGKTVFDANGETVEEYLYNKEGKLKAGHKYKRDNTGDVTEELKYDDKNKLKEKRIVKHNEQGEKLEETFYNATNKLTKKHVYIYDAKGLKTERKTYDDKGKLKSIKKYIYEFAQ